MSPNPVNEILKAFATLIYALPATAHGASGRRRHKLKLTRSYRVAPPPGSSHVLLPFASTRGEKNITRVGKVFCPSKAITI